MKNIRLQLEYDGTDFYGWQRQPGKRTVQGVLEEAIENVFGARRNVVGAGRTDAGVHALDYPCNFAVNTALAPPRIAAALGANLPDDVIVRSVAEVPAGFHARFDALARRYSYHISTRRTALWRRVYHTPRYRLDADAMARAATYLVGKHDFSSFAPTANEAGSVCEVVYAAVEQDDPFITFTIEANRFLQHMVRVMVGTLIDVGRGRDIPEHVETILCKKDRGAAGPTAPPHGLVLMGVRYPDDV